MFEDIKNHKVLKTYKGGSLSSTTLIEHPLFGKVVCKEVSTEKNREYGFVRFNSQIKRHLLLSSIEKSLYPKILQVGINNKLQKAFCIYEFKENFIPLIDFLNSRDLNDKQVENAVINTKLSLDKIHNFKSNFNDPPGTLNYYVEEEMIRPLITYKAILDQDKLIFENRDVTKTEIFIEKIRNKLEKIKDSPKTTYVHGNSTLENILINPLTLNICFIDVYDETYLNSPVSDYSQILQCSKYFYGLKMREPKIENQITNLFNFKLVKGPYNLTLFNKFFEKLIFHEMISEHLISLMCASQFTRLLPFRIQSGDLYNAKYFFSLADYIISK